jgi:CRP-like cAMP-binding protein
MRNAALTSDERLRAVGACPLFAGIPPAEQRILAEMMRTEHLLAGETLFEAGEAADSVYLIVEGTLQVFLPHASRPVRALSAGDLLGEYGLLTRLGRTATVRAATEAILLSLDDQRFRAFLLRFPEATLALLKTTVARLLEAERTAADSHARW